MPEVLLVHSDQPNLRVRIAADDAGRFNVKLVSWPAWCTRRADGRDVFQGQIEIFATGDQLACASANSDSSRSKLLVAVNLC